MKTAIIVIGILLVVIFVVALTICFLDVLLTRLRQKRTVVERQIERPPVVVPEPVIVEVKVEPPVEYPEDIAEGYRGYINLGILEKHFESGEVVSLETLKERKLLPPKAKRVKILSEGMLTKALVVKAHAFSNQAIDRIILMGGSVEKLKEKS